MRVAVHIRTDGRTDGLTAVNRAAECGPVAEPLRISERMFHAQIVTGTHPGSVCVLCASVTS